MKVLAYQRTLICLLGLSFSLLLQSCHEASSHEITSSQPVNVRFNQDEIHKATSYLKDGDLILRTGKDFISMTLRQFSRQDKTYSHCGIIRKEKDEFFVYHAIGGEDNPEATLRRERFVDFCNPVNNSGFGIFRYQLNQKQAGRLDSIVVRLYQQKVPFDMKFDLKTDSSLYCAEFVYKALQKATEQPDYLPISNIGHFQYVAIDNLFLNKHTKRIYQTIFR